MMMNHHRQRKKRGNGQILFALVHFYKFDGLKISSGPVRQPPRFSSPQEAVFVPSTGITFHHHHHHRRWRRELLHENPTE